VVVYATHLLRVVLRDPERLGGWLHRLAVGWYKARRDATAAKRDHEVELAVLGLTEAAIQAELPRLLIAARDLQSFRPVEVTVIGHTETPEDITKALEAD
jgi:hypothetical protein